MAQSTTTEPEKLQIIDLVRSGCILMVIFYHFITCVQEKCNRPITYFGQIPEWPSEFWVNLSKNGTYGVLLFFVVSGFLITRLISRFSESLLKPDLRQFYTRRVARIFPLYYLAIAFGAAVMYLFQSQYFPFTIFFKNTRPPYDFSFWGTVLTFTYNWYRLANVRSFELNGKYWDVLWSLSIEEQFYFFYPLILLSLRTRRNLYFFLIAAIIIGPLVRIYDISHNPQYHWMNFLDTFGIFDALAAGALLYIFSEDFKDFFNPRKLLCAILCLLGFCILLKVYFGTYIMYYPDQKFIPSALSLGLFLFLLGGLHLDFFQSKFLRIFSFPGKWSYGIYLIHVTVLYFLGPSLSRETAISNFFIFFIITLLVAFLSYRFFEVPANQFIRNLFKAPPLGEVTNTKVSLLMHSSSNPLKIMENFTKLPTGFKTSLLGLVLALVGVTIGWWGVYSGDADGAVIFGIALGATGSLIGLFGLFLGRIQKKNESE